MEKLSAINLTASNCSTLPSASSSVATVGFQQGQNYAGYAGSAQQLTATGGQLNSWYPYQQPYTYYYYVPSYAPASVKPTAAELIALYKKEFGKDWKRIYAATVRIEAR